MGILCLLSWLITLPFSTLKPGSKGAKTPIAQQRNYTDQRHSTPTRKLAKYYSRQHYHLRLSHIKDMQSWKQKQVVKCSVP